MNQLDTISHKAGLVILRRVNFAFLETPCTPYPGTLSSACLGVFSGSQSIWEGGDKEVSLQLPPLL